MPVQFTTAERNSQVFDDCTQKAPRRTLFKASSLTARSLTSDCRCQRIDSQMAKSGCGRKRRRSQSSGIMRRFGCLVELFLHRRYFVLISSIIILTPSSPHKSRLPFQMSHINMVVMKSNYHCIILLKFSAVFLHLVSKIA